MKRFTETTKWADPWFMDLPVKYKAFWIYICDQCDCAGVWEPNMRLAMTQIGEPMELVEILRVFEKRIEQTQDGRLFIRSFIRFQYGIELNPSNTAHLGVLRRLESSKIKPPVAVAPVKELQRGYQAPKDKDKDKDTKGLSQNEWIADLKADPAYKNINVQREFDKAARWCKENNRTLTRRRFVNWLNRADQRIVSPKQAAPHYAKLPPKRTPTDEEFNQAQRTAREETQRLKAQLQ